MGKLLVISYFFSHSRCLRG